MKYTSGTSKPKAPPSLVKPMGDVPQLSSGPAQQAMAAAMQSPGYPALPAGKTANAIRGDHTSVPMNKKVAQPHTANQRGTTGGNIPGGPKGNQGERGGIINPRDGGIAGF